MPKRKRRTEREKQELLERMRRTLDEADAARRNRPPRELPPDGSFGGPDGKWTEEGFEDRITPRSPEPEE